MPRSRVNISHLVAAWLAVGLDHLALKSFVTCSYGNIPHFKIIIITIIKANVSSIRFEVVCCMFLWKFSTHLNRKSFLIFENAV